MLLYLCRALKLTNRSRWDWVWTSLFLTECSCKLDTDSTSKSDRMELRPSGRHETAAVVIHDGVETVFFVHLTMYNGYDMLILAASLDQPVFFTTLIILSTKISVNVYII